MDNIINIGVFNKKENTEYYGKVQITNIPSGYNCKYSLISQKDKNKKFEGDFIVNSNKIATIINYLDSHINTLSES